MSFNEVMGELRSVVQSNDCDEVVRLIKQPIDITKEQAAVCRRYIEDHFGEGFIKLSWSKVKTIGEIANPWPLWSDALFGLVSKSFTDRFPGHGDSIASCYYVFRPLEYKVTSDVKSIFYKILIDKQKAWFIEKDLQNYLLATGNNLIIEKIESLFRIRETQTDYSGMTYTYGEICMAYRELLIEMRQHNFNPKLFPIVEMELDPYLYRVAEAGLPRPLGSSAEVSRQVNEAVSRMYEEIGQTLRKQGVSDE